MAFRETAGEQAYLKAGLMGFAGAGKTYTAKEIAIGLHKYCEEKGLRKKGAPVFFLDTESGSDWVRKDFQKAGIPLMVDKTNAFTSLVPSVQQASADNGILIIDSITHFWRELCDSYARKKRRTNLEFQDWAWLKAQWAKFTTEFINSQCHIIMCGRAGYEYDFKEQESGKTELVKTGVKMKAETEAGFEPSILVLMERVHSMSQGGDRDITITRTAQVLKDRACEIDGMTFTNPKFKDFLPHIKELNLGGTHVGVDDSQTSLNIVPDDDKSWVREKNRRDIVLEEIQQHIILLYPSSSAADKKGKADFLQDWFDTRSWKRVSTMSSGVLGEKYKAMQKERADG